MTNLLCRLFIRDYRDTANAAVREAYGKLAGAVGIVTNLLLFAVKITVGLLFHSIAIMADAVNNLSDSASSIITLVGFTLSGKPADATHPYGHERIEYISGLLISFVVLILGFQLAQSSFEKTLKPEGGESGAAVVLVLAASIGLKLWQGLFYRKMGRIIASPTLAAAASDSRNDVISTSVVLAGMVISWAFSVNLDGYLGLAVALFILVSGVKMVFDTANPLLGMAPQEELVEQIYEKIMSYPGVIGMHDLTVHNYGPSRCFASVHCEVPASQDILVSHDIIDNIERDFLAQMNIHLVIHLDPVVTGDERTDRLREQVGALLKGLSPELSVHDFRVVFGTTHSNLIFDVVAPFGFRMSDAALAQEIKDRVHALDPRLEAVPTIDHSYVPAPGGGKR